MTYERVTEPKTIVRPGEQTKADSRSYRLK